MKKYIATSQAINYAIKHLLDRPGTWASAETGKMVTRWDDELKFECESDKGVFYTDNIMEAVDWLYAEQDPYKEESKPESEVKFSAEAKPEITREDIEEAKREVKGDLLEHLQTCFDKMAQQSLELYINDGVTYCNDMYLGELKAFGKALAQVNAILESL
jgi:hypothetical protein